MYRRAEVTYVTVSSKDNSLLRASKDLKYKRASLVFNMCTQSGINFDCDFYSNNDAHLQLEALPQQPRSRDL